MKLNLSVFFCTFALRKRSFETGEECDQIMRPSHRISHFRKKILKVVTIKLFNRRTDSRFDLDISLINWTSYGYIYEICIYG